MLRNTVQQDAKIKVLITIIIALLFPNYRLMLCSISRFSQEVSRLSAQVWIIRGASI